MKQLDPNGVGWVFAFKNSETTEYYHKHYAYSTDRKPSMALLGKILLSVLIECGELGTAMRYLHMDYLLYTIEYKREAFTYNEMIYLAFRTWAFHLDVNELSRLTDGKWKKC
jgi:hypothetical protein